MEEVPAGRCGHTFTERSGDEGNPIYQSCCFREALPDHDRCAWHAPPDETEEKTVQNLRNARVDKETKKESRAFGELLNGAILSGIKLDSEISLNNIALCEAEFSNAELHDIDLSKADLHGANFSQAELNGADLSKSYMAEADLSGADLSDANLAGAYLADVNLSDAELYEAKLQEAYLSGADLSEAELFSANLSEAHLSDTALTGADLLDTNFSEAELHNADLSEANIEGADLSEVSLYNADLSKATLYNADLSEAELYDSNLSETVLGEANLSDADMLEANLSEASLNDADLSRARLVGANLLGADLARADLSESNLNKATLSNTSGEESNLKKANLENAKFKNANLTESTLTSADCESADFSGANLNRATLENADLTGADLSQAYLYQTRLTGAQINETTQFYKKGGIGDTSSSNPCRYDSGIRPNEPSETIEAKATKNEDKTPEEARARRARSTYSRLEDLARENGFPELKSEMFVRRQDARKELLSAQGQSFKYRFAQLQSWLFRYGESFLRIIIISVATVAIWWVAYMLTGTMVDSDGTIITWQAIINDPTLVLKTLSQSVYVFASGNQVLAPANLWGQVLVAVESIIGPLLVALLIFVLGRRAAR